MTVEYAWLCGDLQGKELEIPSFEDCASVQGLRDYSARSHAEIAPFIYAWNDSLEDRIMYDTNQNGEQESFTFGEVMRHVITKFTISVNCQYGLEKSERRRLQQT